MKRRLVSFASEDCLYVSVVWIASYWIPVNREYEYGLYTDPVLHVFLYREWWVHMSNEMTGLPLSKGYRTLFASLGDLIKEWPKWLRVENHWPVQLMGSRRWPENLRFVRLFVSFSYYNFRFMNNQELHLARKWSSGFSLNHQ